MKTGFLKKQHVSNMATLMLVILMFVAYQVYSVLAVSTTQITIPTIIPYQGLLTDRAGQPIDGTVNLTFRLYSSPSGGAALWTESHNNVPIQKGLFKVSLGSQTAIADSVWKQGPLYVGIAVNGDGEMTPREQLGQVPYAAVAGTVVESQVKIWHAEGTTDTTTASTSAKVLQNMALDINTSGGTVEVGFDAGFKMDAGSDFANFAIFIDGKEKNRHAKTVVAGGRSDNVQLTWVGTLPAGNHKIEIKWWVISSSSQISIRAATNPWEKRYLMVKEYR